MSLEKSLGALAVGGSILAVNYIEPAKEYFTRFASDSRMDFLADEIFVRNTGIAVVLGGLVGLAVSAYRSRTCKE